MRRLVFLILIFDGVVTLATGTARGDVSEFADKDEWLTAVAAFTTIDFTGFPEGTFITDQYADLGVLFTDGNDSTKTTPSFPNDGWGLDGNDTSITVVFDQPQAWIGVDYPGLMQIELVLAGKLIFESSLFGGDPGSFLGLVSTEVFDTAVLNDPIGEVFVDDLHFGPAPCLGDLDGDAIVGFSDFLQMLAAWGTDPGGPPDLDGDGNVGITDFLKLLANWGPCPFFVDCNGNGVWDHIELQNGTSPDCNGNWDLDECDIADGTSPDCNSDGVPDECDEDCNHNDVPDGCDIAGGTSPDANGNGIPDECEFPNDECEDAIAITEGFTPFSTVGATTDGHLTFNCEGGQATTFVQDVWFLYTPSCTGVATFSLCNDADFDTRLALYFAGPCPPINPLACSDNAPGCSLTSEIQHVVGEGIPYLVRIGGTQGDGTGVLTISCESSP